MLISRLFTRGFSLSLPERERERGPGRLFIVQRYKPGFIWLSNLVIFQYLPGEIDFFRCKISFWELYWPIITERCTETNVFSFAEPVICLLNTFTTHVILRIIQSSVIINQNHIIYNRHYEHERSLKPFECKCEDVLNAQQAQVRKWMHIKSKRKHNECLMLCSKTQGNAFWSSRLFLRQHVCKQNCRPCHCKEQQWGGGGGIQIAS